MLHTLNYIVPSSLFQQGSNRFYACTKLVWTDLVTLVSSLEDVYVSSPYQYICFVVEVCRVVYEFVRICLFRLFISIRFGLVVVILFLIK